MVKKNSTPARIDSPMANPAFGTNPSGERPTCARPAENGFRSARIQLPLAEESKELPAAEKKTTG
jgi:hypothetical protein